VVVASAPRTEDSGFKSHQGVKSLNIAVLLSNRYMHCHCVYLTQIPKRQKMFFKKEEKPNYFRCIKSPEPDFPYLLTCKRAL
jgi:hypothetical protein